MANPPGIVIDYLKEFLVFLVIMQHSGEIESDAEMEI
jgi:hypothetical protein